VSPPPRRPAGAGQCSVEEIRGTTTTATTSQHHDHDAVGAAAPAGGGVGRRRPPVRAATTALRSLRPLVDEISAAAASSEGETPVIFVGGKGGVGKTSVSSSLAVELASSPGLDLSVLVVSTDPAHSLGDALDVDLRSSPEPAVLGDPLTDRRLSALEVDPRSALDEFRKNLELFDVNRLSSSLGVDVSPRLLEDLGIDELSSLIRNPPPGLDELVALANVLDPRNSEKYDVIVVDTAPTGHTLRMLQLPQFLDGFLRTLLTLRTKLKGLISTVQMFMGQQAQSSEPKITVDDALTALEDFQRRAADLRRRLQDPDATRFVVVSIPTVLSVSESERLVDELTGEGIRVSDVVINQCVGSGGGDGGGEGPDGEAMRRYYRRRVDGQRRWIGELTGACAEVSGSEEYRSNAGGDEDEGRPINVREVPFYDMELVGVPALGYLGGRTFAGGGFERLVSFDDTADAGPDAPRNPKLVVCGGKGGVGKTTTSASLAIALASAGHSVALVSTDPAHSLGDALDMDLRGGSLTDVPLYGVPPAPGALPGGDDGTLSAMEIDPTAALSEFRDSVDRLIGKDREDGGDGGSEISSTLSSLGEIIDTLPAGTDEVVALAKVIQLIRRGTYDRVVLDTAPTGHTLRMLTTPSFLADLIERVLVVSRRLNSNPAVKMLINGAAGSNRADLDDAAESAKSALLKFQVSMYDLEDLFADPSATEFLIVTIGTELAVRESVRLLNDLTFGDPDMPIRVRSVVVNQVLDGDGGDDGQLEGFVSRLTASQASSIGRMERIAGGMDDPPRLTRVAMLDTEPRGVYGLKALSGQLVAETEEAAGAR